MLGDKNETYLCSKIISTLRQIAENCVMNDQLGTIVQYFERVFDIEESEENSRFVVKHGVDSSLDHKKKVHNGLPNLLFQLAQEEVMKHRAKAFLKLYIFAILYSI